ncbi:MAG: LacI family DNA-binding transcriptional regulator [Flaviflexus sp.]|nr:LacI family DNA-binding transcriptional regulator [Flaviflexus sp.]
MSKVTVRQVAEEANVSIATVSRVLAGMDNVRPATTERVRAAMTALGYSPNRMAQSLRSQRTMNLGIVLPGFDNPFFFELIKQAVDVAGDSGYSVVIAGGEDPFTEARRLVDGKLVDGLVFVAPSHALDVPAEALELGLPLVAFDRAPADLDCPLIQVDNVRGAREVTEHLIATGARSIAHITGPAHLEVSQQRRAGYEQALTDAGMKLDPSLVLEGDFTERRGAQAMIDLLNRADRPDAVFAANDLSAIGALSAATHLSQVPHTIQVAGFDGLTVSKYTSPALTTYTQPIHTIARLSVERLIELIRDPESTSAESILVPGTLVVRQSTHQE